MDDDTITGSVCPGLDLAARLAAEVTQARMLLLAAEERYEDAASRSGGGHEQIPLGIRRDLRLCRHRLRVLGRICEELPTGGDHARSA